MMKKFISFAQNFEDVFINRCFSDRASGFYIDVGASHPVRDSPTYASYCKGWYGLNIEPIAERVLELRRLRPRDVTLQGVAGAKAGEATLYRTDGIGGLSSCKAEVVAPLRERSSIDPLTVQVFTLDDVCDEYGLADVQVLKIDVEGYENEVLQGFKFERCRPELLIVEAFSMGASDDSGEWIARLQQSDYLEVYDDALNKFFIRQESFNLRAHFDKPVSVLDEVVQFNAQGSALIRSDHPDHEWAAECLAPVVRHLSRLAHEDALDIMTADIANAALRADVDLDGINRAYRLVLGRWATHEEATEVATRVNATGLELKTLIFELLITPEYVDRIARVAASI